MSQKVYFWGGESARAPPSETSVVRRPQAKDAPHHHFRRYPQAQRRPASARRWPSAEADLLSALRCHVRLGAGGLAALCRKHKV